MSNELTEYCELFRLDKAKALNLLTDWGLVSDNCLILEEVAPCDRELATKFVRHNANDLKTQAVGS